MLPLRRIIHPHVLLSECVDATGAPFSGGARSLHSYTRRLLTAADTGAPRATAPQFATPGEGPPALTDLFPELAGTPADHPAHSLPADTHLIPWFHGGIDDQIAETQRVLKREFPEVDTPSNPVFGTMSNRQAEIEEQRLSAIYESIRDSGFRRDRRDPIQGVLLTRRDGARRFLVMAGKHRVAALAALRANHPGHAGGRRLPARITVRLRHPGVVRRGDVEKWPLVSSGFWPREAALSYFDRLFDGRSCFER